MGRIINNNCKKLFTFIYLIFLTLSFIIFIGPKVNAVSTGDVSVSLNLAFDTYNISKTTINTDQGSTLDISSRLNVPGYQFSFWIVNGVVRKDLDASSAFLASDGLVLTAVYDNFNNHPVVFMDSNGYLIGTVQYVNTGQSSNVPTVSTKNYNKPGYTLKLNSSNEPIWRSVIGDKDPVSITKATVFSLSYELINPDKTVLINGEELPYDIVHTLVATDPNFNHWVDENGDIVSFDRELKLSTIVDRNINETDYVVEEMPLVTMMDVTGIRSGSQSYLGRYYLPEGYELVDFGFKVGNDLVQSNSSHPVTNEFLRSM